MGIDNIHERKEEKEKINIHDPLELRYWSNKFGVTKEHILEAVRSEGDSVKGIEDYIKKNNIHITKNT
jgi:hypothetical protein